MKTLLSLLTLANILFASDGLNVGDNTRKHYTSNFISTISNPMTSDTEFSTIDGSKNFKANLTCNEDVNSFLTIEYSGSSDITVYVNLDTNLDGTKNKSFSFNGISGIGSNGVVKCNSNTWKNCNYHLWNLSNDNLELISTIRNNIGGAYCINNSCGSLSSTDKKGILDTLGGAISSLYQSYNKNYLVTKTTNDGQKIEFYGQNFEECNNYKESSKTPNYSDTDDSGLDGSSEVAASLNDENSLYYSFAQSTSNINENKLTSEEKQNIKDANKDISVQGDTSDYSFTYSGSTKDENGNWNISNGDAKVNIDFINPDIKYCEVKYLEENSIVFSDGETHHTTKGNTQVWRTNIRECTGDDYETCPHDSAKNEIIKHPCGEIDNFSEATSIMSSVQEATNDISCGL